jgi:1-acyl-sn-glycerol-3-phosphate acyltransferase
MTPDAEGRVIPIKRATTGRAGADAVRAGAQRASGERARRRRTPLITEPPGVSDQIEPAEPIQPAEPIEGAPETGPAGAAPTSTGVLGLDPATILRFAVEAVVEALVSEGRRAGIADVDRYVASALAFLRRRLAGDYVVDEFGFDADLTDALLPTLRPLYRKWFRVEVRGIDNIPSSGGALIVANHSGTVALDSLMTQVAVHDEHPAGRYLRLLGADLVFATPFVGSLARKTGSTLAANPDAERLLRAGELVGVWPEGFKGIGKPFSERYKLQRFGRGGFVAAALQAGVPIVPCSIVGAEEIYPILGNFTTLARLLGLPYLPMTPTFPWLGPLGLVPLPSKWIIEFGAPIETVDHGAGAADDPMLVFNITDQVRETIQQTLYALLMQRRSVFFS